MNIIHYGNEDSDLRNSEVENKFWLDHSCDEWIIGSLEDAEIFYEELGRKIAEVKSLS